ncbi:cytochrome c oxidase subunit II [Sphingomonas alba]|uniref:Cytochrome c oxidase subunit 2 n=1 Tax=Sphingomonas alba TaxID=2908208 RepID=A0ABT0RNA4_9SPHN|nr:cytochrome c oxidase subunit II [Sphingomonas alba]MCL6684000.1 cytochrome c oxidase subunit II [Sphingomonas alba]
MKRIGWAIALAAAAMTPLAAAAPQATAPAANTTAPANDTAPAAPGIPMVAPTPDIGEPTPGGIAIQPQVTELGREAQSFHNNWLLLLCGLISALVLALLVWTLIRFNRKANPTPSRTSHNTAIEVVWTLVPVLILVGIAIPSIGLLRKQYSPPPADLTVKVIGNQWYWTYQYPDNGGFEIVANMLKEKDQVKAGERYRTDADGPKLLAVDERIVIPQGKIVKFIVTSNDVIHSFAVPAFWTKIDANPGRLNETWVKVDRPGVYFGQCSELCGARHGFMPIAVQVVPPAEFAQWVASKGGTMPGAKPAATPDSTAASPVTEAAVPAAGGAPQPAVAPGAAPATAQPATNQAATAQN